MFRTSNVRGQSRFDTLKVFKGTKNTNIKLTPQQVELIELSQALTLAEKIELLLVSLGNKLTTELYANVTYQWHDNKQKGMPSTNDVSAIKSLLDKLPFIYFVDTLPKKNRQTSKAQKFIWFQVSINEAVSEFMKSYPDDLTEFEEGVLYGYPLSAIRAFSGLIEAKHDKPTAAGYFLAGVCSKEFWGDEQDYYDMWWSRLKELSPTLVTQAEAYFSMHKNANHHL